MSNRINPLRKKLHVAAKLLQMVRIQISDASGFMSFRRLAQEYEDTLWDVWEMYHEFKRAVWTRERNRSRGTNQIDDLSELRDVRGVRRATRRPLLAVWLKNHCGKRLG